MRRELEELIARAGGAGNVMVWLAHASGVGSTEAAARADMQHHVEHPWCAGVDGVVMGIERQEYAELVRGGAREMGHQPPKPPRAWLHRQPLSCERCGTELVGFYAREGRRHLGAAAPPARWGEDNGMATTLIVPCSCGGAGSVGITHVVAPAAGE